MDNIYVKAVVVGGLATLGAFVLNLVLDFTDNTVTTWAVMLVAIVVGTYIGELLSRRRRGTRSG